MNEHAASCTALLRWRGWRPPFLLHEPWEHAVDVALVLEREGDLALLPLGFGRMGTLGKTVEPADLCDAALALRELLADGWRVAGRLHTTFAGLDSEDNFWAGTLESLGLDKLHAADLFGEHLL